jgi:hypothetical protein
MLPRESPDRQPTPSPRPDGIPGGAAQSRRVSFAERKANGYQAFFEYMPRLEMRAA